MKVTLFELERLFLESFKGEEGCALPPNGGEIINRSRTIKKIACFFYFFAKRILTREKW